jgi:hypothetical protein
MGCLGVSYHRTFSQYNAEVHFWTHPRCQALANDIGYMVQARRITGLMFRTLRAKNSWREGQSFRDISHRLTSAGVRSGYCKTRPCSVVCFGHDLEAHAWYVVLGWLASRPS